VSDSGLSGSGHQVTKLLARNGRFEGQFTADDQPATMASDGSRIWIACFKHDTLIELRIKDGSVSNIYQLRKGLYDVLYDGSSIWVSNSADNKITKISVQRTDDR
jgi:hypothetical protein